MGTGRDPFTMKLSSCSEDEPSFEGPSDRHPQEVLGSKTPLQRKETRFPKCLPRGLPGPRGISLSSHDSPSKIFEDSCSGKQMAAPQEIQAFQQLRGSSSSHPPLGPTHLSEAVGKDGGHGQGWGPPQGRGQ